MDEQLKSVADVRYAREMLEYDVDAFLRRAGWDSTGGHPAGYLLWSKTVRGKVYNVPKVIALGIQADIEAEARWAIWMTWDVSGMTDWLRYGDRDGSPGEPILFASVEEAGDRIVEKRRSTSGIRYEARLYEAT